MSDRCRAVEERISGLPGSRPNPQTDLPCGCDSCVDQVRIDGLLRDHFQELAAPALTPGFSRKLRTRLAAERRKERVKRRWKHLLQTYWLFAALASAIIIARLPDPLGWLPDSQLLMPALLVIAAIPFGLLLRALKKDPIELVFTTFEWFR
jgi:hypothetical protein